jgi:hypothetical protein
MNGARNPIPPIMSLRVLSAWAEVDADAGTAATASMSAVASIVRFKGFLLR